MTFSCGPNVVYWPVVDDLLYMISFFAITT